jgi:hypothetical protein
VELCRFEGPLHYSILSPFARVAVLSVAYSF